MVHILKVKKRIINKPMKRSSSFLIITNVCVCVCVCSVESNSATLWNVATRLLFPWHFPGKNTAVGCHSNSGILPDPGIKPTCLESLALAGRFFATSATWESLMATHDLKVK